MLSETALHVCVYSTMTSTVTSYVQLVEQNWVVRKALLACFTSLTVVASRDMSRSSHSAIRTYAMGCVGGGEEGGSKLSRMGVISSELVSEESHFGVNISCLHCTRYTMRFMLLELYAPCPISR